VLKSGRPVIGVGTGGGHFLDQVHTPELNIGWGPSWVATTDRGYVDDPGLVTYFFDNHISIPGDGILTMLTGAAATYAVYNPPTSVVKVLRQHDDTSHWTVAQEDRFLQWGYSASPATMTTTAKDLFINCLYYMQGK
jgi:hypothetical protein